MNTEELLTYWRKVKETIHLFDEIIVRHTAQWSNILLVMIGASAVAYSFSDLVAALLASGATIASILGLWKCYFYFELLEEALRVGVDIEKLIFKGEEREFGLTHRLKSISTRQFLGLIFFGWSIFLPFIVLAVLSSALAAIYFKVIITLDVIPWIITITTIIIAILVVRLRR